MADEAVTIIGHLADGSQTIAGERREIPALEIHDTVVQTVPQGSITIHRVKPPDSPLPSRFESEVSGDAYLGDAATVNEFLAVFATVVDRRATYLRWFFDRQEYSAWSNVDFNYLLGFSRFRKGDREFTSMLFLSNVASSDRAGLSQEVDDFLATLPADSPGFLPVEGDFANAEALEGIEALHDLYVAEEARLKDAYELRQQAKDEEIPSEPETKDVTVHFWKVQ